MGPVKRWLSGLLDIATTRGELLVNEWQEERLRLARLLFTLLFALMFSTLALLGLSALVVALLWEQHPYAALVGLTLLYGLIALALFGRFRFQLQAGSRMFSASLSELQRDRSMLHSRDE